MGVAGPNPPTKTPPGYALGKTLKQEGGGDGGGGGEGAGGGGGRGQWALQGWGELRGEGCDADICREQQQTGPAPSASGPVQSRAAQRCTRHWLFSLALVAAWPHPPSYHLSLGGRPARVGYCHSQWVPHCPLPNNHHVTHRTTHTWSTWRPPFRPDDGCYVQEGAALAKVTQPLWGGGSWDLRASGKTFSLSLWTKSLGHLVVHEGSRAGARAWDWPQDLIVSSWS